MDRMRRSGLAEMHFWLRCYRNPSFYGVSGHSGHDCLTIIWRTDAPIGIFWMPPNQ